jgi:hypothetical protein
MENIEKIERIREKTGISYEEAKKVLEENNYDLLDAMIALEKEGKVKAPEQDRYTTTNEQPVNLEFEKTQRAYEKDCKKTSFGQMLDKFFELCGKLIKSSVETSFIVEKRGNVVINVPVLVLIVCLLAFGITVPLLIIGLFFEYRYRFEGIDTVNINFDINKACDEASEMCDNIKKDFKK